MTYTSGPFSCPWSNAFISDWTLSSSVQEMYKASPFTNYKLLSIKSNLSNIFKYSPPTVHFIGEGNITDAMVHFHVGLESLARCSQLWLFPFLSPDIYQQEIRLIPWEYIPRPHLLPFPKPPSPGELQWGELSSGLCTCIPSAQNDLPLCMANSLWFNSQVKCSFFKDNLKLSKIVTQQEANFSHLTIYFLIELITVYSKCVYIYWYM